MDRSYKDKDLHQNSSKVPKSINGESNIESDELVNSRVQELQELISKDCYQNDKELYKSLDSKFKSMTVDELVSIKTDDPVILEMISGYVFYKLQSEYDINALKDLCFDNQDYNEFVVKLIDFKISSIYNVYQLLSLSLDCIYSDQIKDSILKKLQSFDIYKLLDVDFDMNIDLLETTIFEKLEALTDTEILTIKPNQGEENKYLCEFIDEKYKTKDLVLHQHKNANFLRVLNDRLSKYLELDLESLLELSNVKHSYRDYFEFFVDRLTQPEKIVINQRLEELVLDSANLKEVFAKRDYIVVLSNALGGKYKHREKTLEEKRLIREKNFGASDPENRFSGYVDFDNDIKSVIQNMSFSELFFFENSGIIGFDMPINRFVINLLKESPYEKSIYEMLLSLDKSFIDSIFHAKFEIIDAYLKKHARAFLDEGGQLPQGDYLELSSVFPKGGTEGNKYEYYKQYLINISYDLEILEKETLEQIKRNDYRFVNEIKDLCRKLSFFRRRSTDENEYIQTLIDECSSNAFVNDSLDGLDLRGLDFTGKNMGDTTFKGSKR